MHQLCLFDEPPILTPVEYYPNFLLKPEADALFTHCQSLAWQQNQIRMLGKPMKVPRLECMYGEEATYLYSGSVELNSRPWTPELLELRNRILAQYGRKFEIVIGNLYRDGQDSIGWHSDNEPSMGVRPAIGSISLGACRKFSVKAKAKGSKATHYWLEHGSLLLMQPGCQEGWSHQLPKTSNLVGQRINLTFRPYGRLSS